jgi:hypothetical protein
MEIIHNQNHSQSLNTVRGGKNASDTLQAAEKELLYQMSETFTIIYGGQFKRRRQTA